MALPLTGTVTFLFTDIEGSTRLFQQLGDARAADVLTAHRQILRSAFDRFGGRELETQGDGFLVAFQSARDAVQATIEGQRAINAHGWADGVALRVRMGMHTTEPASSGGALFGLGLHRAARMCAAGWGGQVLLSHTTGDVIGGDLPPGARLRDLGQCRLKDLQQPERIFQLLHPDLPADFPPLRSLDTLPTNLPVQLSSFIGRQQEIIEIRRLIDRSRLVTLVGPGGMGKTRLALQAAAGVVDAFRDGVWLVELAALADPALVPQAVAAVLEVREQPGRALTETLTDHLRPKHTLLLLDNCEHLVAACAQLTDTLLRHCRGLRVLTTSREALGITGETVFPVPPLSLPEIDRLPSLDGLRDYEAFTLFIDRARAVLPAFRLTDADGPTVARICHRLDGMPLAIELAAARVKVLSLDEIARKLDDRFRLLTGGSRTALPRHQTLQAAIAWSYDLLSEQERRVLRRLSVFAGGFDLAAAEAVCAGDSVEVDQIFDLVSRLADKSLVVADQQDGDVRYRLLDTVRQYSSDRLREAGEVDAARDRHLDYFVSLAETAEPDLYWGSEESMWVTRLDKELGNLRVAMDWSASQRGGIDKGLRLVSAIWWLWFVLGYLSEGRGYLESMLARSASTAPIRAKAVNALGCLLAYQGDMPTVRTLFEESLALYRELDDKTGIAELLNNLGLTIGTIGDRAHGRQLIEECMALSREIGNLVFLARGMQSLAEILSLSGELAEARSLLEESLGIGESLGNKTLISSAYLDLGRVAVLNGDHLAALASLRDALRVKAELRERWFVAMCVEGLAEVYTALGQSNKGARLLGSATVLWQAIGALDHIWMRAARERTVSRLRSVLGDDAFQAASAEGRAMPLEQVIEYAVSEAE